MKNFIMLLGRIILPKNYFRPRPQPPLHTIQFRIGTDLINDVITPTSSSSPFLALVELRSSGFLMIFPLFSAPKQPSTVDIDAATSSTQQFFSNSTLSDDEGLVTHGDFLYTGGIGFSSLSVFFQSLNAPPPNLPLPAASSDEDVAPTEEDVSQVSDLYYPKF